MTTKNIPKFFNSPQFVASYFSVNKLPQHSCREVVFAGRSNCGKSSLINAITGQKKLAITSKTPGRTRSINYFKLNNDNYLIDLPGYGYAQVSSSTKQQWHILLEQFFQTRSSICGVILIMDIRHPLTKFDQQMLDFCGHHSWPTHVVLNKADKLSSQQANSTLQKVSASLNKLAINFSIQCCSTTKKTGVAPLQEKIIGWLEPPLYE